MTFISDNYIWHLYLTFIFDIHIWHLTFISDIYIWHLHLTLISNIATYLWHLYLAFIFDVYIWHLYLTFIFDIATYIWHFYLTFIYDIYIWHLYLACGSIHFPRLFSKQSWKMDWRKSIEDLCEKCSTSRDLCIRFQKTAARTLLFLSEAVSGRRWATMRLNAFTGLSF